MGQKSIPTLNKTGYSMFWNSMWDDKINFSKSLKKDFFLKNVIYFILDEPNSFSIFKKNFKFFKNQIFFKKYKIYYKYNYKNKLIYNKKNSRPIVKYFSKIWILKYQQWFLIFLFTFFNKIIYGKIDTYKNKKSFFEFFFYYHVFILKSNYSYKQFKKNSF